MDVAYLTPAELEYELKIRGVSGLTTTRQRIKALRDFLAREEKGQQAAPKDSSGIVKPSEEIVACGIIYEDVLSQIDEAWKSGDKLRINAGFTRLNYLQLRLERMKPSSTQEESAVRELLDFVYDAIYRLENARADPNSPSYVGQNTSQRVNSRTSEPRSNHSYPL